MAYCIKCGNLLEEGAAFCSKCGTAVENNSKEVNDIVVHGKPCTVGSSLVSFFFSILLYIVFRRLNYALSMMTGNVDSVISICLKVINICVWIFRGISAVGVLLSPITLIIAIIAAFAPDRLEIMFILRNGKVYKMNARNGSMMELPGITGTQIKRKKYVLTYTNSISKMPAKMSLYFNSISEVMRFDRELSKV
ncbi:MAG: zinc-ribbon domain-containing protein [Treponema sp.]|nr:zinc-ribbon domain-containing protein [Eubacterium sp.]MEE0892466.1 zinc-ribbon domain-containing protein [Treponema sp.]